MRLVLSRHGNTFSPGDKALWIGCRSDLPLVEQGRRQAMRLGAELRGAGIVPDAIYCGPLARTSEYAQIVATQLDHSVTPTVDAALTEIDYGGWEGLSSEEIRHRFGAGMLDDWENACAWPASAGWKPGEGELARRVESFVSRLATHGAADTVLAITSNGILRYFLRLDRAAFAARVQARAAKVATGNVCIIEIDASLPRVAVWNAAPEAGLFRSSSSSDAEPPQPIRSA
jgi:broad specificity phosphatase PhoE